MSEDYINLFPQMLINEGQSIKDSLYSKDLKITNDSTLSATSDLNVSIVRINNFNQIKLSQTTRSQHTFPAFSQLSAYSPSVTLPVHQRQKKSENISSVQIKELKVDQLFQCHTCRAVSYENCQLCKGTQKIRGNSSLIKFFEYVIEFKLGSKQSYKEKKTNNSINKTKTGVCSNKIKSSNFLQMREIADNRMSVKSIASKKCNKSEMEIELNSLINVHQNYFCNSCQKTPIIGPRYTCLQCLDFDQCEQCFKMLQHKHRMQKIDLGGKRKQLESIISKFGQPLRLSNFSLGPPPCIQQIQHKKIAESS